MALCHFLTDSLISNSGTPMLADPFGVSRSNGTSSPGSQILWQMGTSPGQMALHHFSILQEPRNVDNRGLETPIRRDDLLAYQELFLASKGMTKLGIVMRGRVNTIPNWTPAYRDAA